MKNDIAGRAVNTKPEKAKRAEPPNDDKNAEPKIKWSKHIVNFMFTMFLVFMIALAVFTTVIPGVLKGASLTIYTQSMEPYLFPGDMVAVIPTEGKNINVGDVISYHPFPNDPTLITHRVIGKAANARDSYHFTLQGDNNPNPDENTVLMKMVAGKVYYKIPKLGHFAQGFGDSQNRSMIIYGVAGLLYFYVVFMIAKEVRKSAKKKKAKRAEKENKSEFDDEKGNETIEENSAI